MSRRFLLAVASLAGLISGDAKAIEPPTGAQPYLMRLGDSCCRSSFELDSPAVSPDGKHVAFGGTWHFGVWNLDSGECLGDGKEQGCGYFWSLAWGSDGNLYVAGQKSEVMRCDPFTQQILQTYPKHRGVIKRISLSADGTRLASAGIDNQVVIWKMPEGEILSTFALSPRRYSWYPAEGISLSPDGKCLVVPGPAEQPVIAYDVDSAAVRWTCSKPMTAIARSEFTTDGTRVVVSNGIKTAVLDAATGTEVSSWSHEKKAGIRTLNVSKDGKRLAVSRWVDSIEVWDVEGARLFRSLEMPGESRAVAAFTADGKSLIAGGSRRAIYRWDVETGEQQSLSRGHGGCIERIAWPSTDRIITVGMDGCCLRWNLASGDAERFATFASPLRPCSLSADGRRLLIASSSEARLLDMTNGAEIIRGPSATMNAGVDTVLSPQATCFAYAGPTPDHAHEPHLCNFSDDTTLEGPRRPLRALSFSHDGKRLAAGFAQDYDEKPAPAGAGILGAALPQRIYHEEPTLLIYDVTDKRVLDQFGEKGVSPTVVSFSPNGKLLAVGLHDNTVQVWDISRRHKFSVGGIHSTSATQLVFTHDSRCLYVVCRMSGTGFELYEVETGTKVRHFAGNHSQTVAVAPSLDDRRVACGGLDTFAFIWDATGVAPDGKLTDLKPDDEHLREWWDELAEKDASIGYAALWQLVASSDLSVAFLRSKLHPVPTIDMAMVDVWIANLDASEFEVREEATRNLERCGNAIESILNARANMAPTTEVQQRLTGLLARLTSTSDYRQRRRGICVLEKIGTQGAQELLKALAAGNPNDRLTQDARESLERLRSR